MIPILYTIDNVFMIPLHKTKNPGRILQFTSTHVIMEFQDPITKLREMYLISTKDVIWATVYHTLHRVYQNHVPDVHIPKKIPSAD